MKLKIIGFLLLFLAPTMTLAQSAAITDGINWNMVTAVVAIIVALATVGMWITSVLNNITNKIENLEGKFDNKFENLEGKMVATPASNSSPLSINDRGRELAQDINANKIFNKHWQHLKQFVEATGATSNYDVQERSNQAALSLVDVLSEEDERIIKEAAYKQGMVYETALSLFAVMTRDKIFEERKAQNKQ